MAAKPDDGLRRIAPSELIVTLLSAVFALSISMQLIPAHSARAATGAARYSAPALDALTATVLPVFLVGAALAIVFVVALLVATSRESLDA